jgi:hypothetical protein
MFALDLFNTDYERRLAEGAVDTLEQRRIDDLAMKMDDLVARAKEPAYKKNPAALAALMKEFTKLKDERDSYYKIREGGIPGSVPTEKIPGKEDLLKGKGRSYYEDQKKNTKQVDEYISMGSDKNYQEAEPYKNYRIYVRKKPFGTTGMYTAHTEIDRKEFMGKGPSQEEAVQAIYDRIDFVLNAQRKVTGSSTIDFNVKFATDLLADPKQTFYAKLENINGQPKLVIASADVASDPELLAAGDFKRSALRNQPDEEGRATPLPGIPLTAKGLRSSDWIANGRYTIGNETQDRDGNRVFDLTYHSTAHTKSDKLRLNRPAFTLGTAREVDEIKNQPTAKQDQSKTDQKHNSLDLNLQRLKMQARKQFPWVNDDQEALILQLLDKENQADELNRQTDSRQDDELQKNFKLDREQEDEIEDLQAKIRVKEHGGGIGPKQRWQDLMPEQYNDDEDYEDEEETELRSGDFVRDTMDGEYGEVFRMQGDPEERRVRILDRDGKGWYIEPSRLTRVDPTDPDVQRYFGKQRVRDMDEGSLEEIDRRGFLKGLGATAGAAALGAPKDASAYTKEIYEKVASICYLYLACKEPYQNAEATKGRTITVSPEVCQKTNQLIQKFIRVYPGGKDLLNSTYGTVYSLVQQDENQKPFKGSVLNRVYFDTAFQQRLLNDFASLIEFNENTVAEGWSDAMLARRTGTPRTPYSVYIKGRKWKDFESDDHAEAVANKLRAKFKADGRDPSVITVAPTDYDRPVKEDQDTSGVERAILNRIMVAHTDLLKQFGPQKVMQAAEEVAYNVGDVDEIGTSDVSAYVAQVKQILGAAP